MLSPSTPDGFAHQRLDAYQLTLELVRGVVTLTRGFATGNAELKDQLVRSALATMRHIAEGASRASPADRRQRYVVARGECAECDASLEACAIVGSASEVAVSPLRQLTQRIGAMLSGLINSERSRMPGT